jgi:hypothetical protein
MSNDTPSTSTTHPAHPYLNQGLRLLIADNLGCRNRVQMLLDAVAVAHAFTIEKQTTTLHALVERLEQVDGSATHLDAAQLELIKSAMTSLGASMASGLSSTMRASAVILAHSHVDDALNRILFLCVLYRPVAWKEEFYKTSQKRYSLQDLEGLDTTKLLADASTEYLARIKHSKVTKRNRLALRHIGKFGTNADKTRISESSLEKFDSRRHALIHRNELIRGELDESVEHECLEVVDHLNNLLQSLSEYVGLSWDELTELRPIEDDD